jgi:hypothetical protein
MVPGLCHGRLSSSLRVLHFQSCAIDAGTLVALLEHLQDHCTLEDLAISHRNDNHHEAQDYIGGTMIGKALAGFFRCNKSLVKLSLSCIDLLGGVLRESLIGLHENKTLETIMFGKCPIDNEGLISLGAALQRDSISLREIGLSSNTGGGDDRHVDAIKDGTRAFLTSLASMSKIQKVHFAGTMRNFGTDGELRRLLQFK